MVADATAIAITNGPGGLVGAWIGVGALRAGPLGAAVSTIATTDAAPAMPPNDHGHVIGHVADASAYGVSRGAAGHAAHPVALGPALGARTVAPDGDAMVGVLIGSDPIAVVGAGFFATWSDP